MTEIAERLEELRERGLYRRLRLIGGPQGPRVTLDGKPGAAALLERLPRPRQSPEGPRRGSGGGDALGRRRRRFAPDLGQHAAALLAWRRGWPRFKGYESALLFGSGYLANTGTIAALAGEGEVVFSDELNHASIIDGCRLSRAETFVYRHGDVEHLAWGLREAGERARADRHRRRLLDGRRRRAAGRAGRSWPDATAAA